MKTREEIIEAYFRALGWKLEEPPSRVVYPAWVMPNGGRWAGASLPPIDRDFELFKKHVIEPMRERGMSPAIVVCSLDEKFKWEHADSYKRDSDWFTIADDQWLLVAIEAATDVLEGGKE